MVTDNSIKEYLEKYGDDLIVRNNWIVGVCKCKGKGIGRCKGNGWARHVKNKIEDEPAFDFNKCKYIQKIEDEVNKS